jgi:predicted nucleic acid-binding protein
MSLKTIRIGRIGRSDNSKPPQRRMNWRSMLSSTQSYRRIHDLDAMLAAAGIVLMQIPRPALFLAGKAFQRYRRAGGAKTGVLADFFIGAHAVIEDAALITRQDARYRTYFPGIALIAPN